MMSYIKHCIDFFQQIILLKMKGEKMYIVITSLYPNDKAKEVAKMYLKCLEKYPVDNSVATPIVPVAIRATQQGIRTIVISEVKKGKFDDAMAISTNRMVMFHDIEGYRYSIKPFLTLEEGLKLIGM
jgi:hypothetical protein